ncbi:hypothetical protein ACWEP4_41900 [Streptomyces sp. NPDC004227]
MSYRPYPNVDRARQQLQGGRVRPQTRRRAVGRVVTIRDFGLAPSPGPNPFGEAIVGELAWWSEAFQAMGRHKTGEEPTTERDGQHD